MLDHDQYERLQFTMQAVAEGRVRKHVLLLGAGGIGKTEAVKAVFPMTDQEARQIDKTVRNSLNPLMEQIELIDDWINLDDDALEAMFPEKETLQDEEGNDIESEDDDGPYGELAGMSAAEIREELEFRKLKLRVRESAILERLPTFMWYQGTLTTKGAYEFGYYYRHEHWKNLIFNDISVHGSGSVFWKQFLERDGLRQINWTISESAKNKSRIPAKYLINARVIFIANKFTPVDDADWDAVISRITGVRFNPSVKERIGYLATWFMDEKLLAVIAEDFKAKKIADLDLRKVVQAGDLRAAGFPEKEWRQFLADAYLPRNVDHLPVDSHAIIEHIRKHCENNRIRETELYKKLNRFKGLGAESGKPRLATALKFLVENHYMEKLDRVAANGAADLYRMFTPSEREEQLRKKK
jgi:hypothetical protein